MPIFEDRHLLWRSITDAAKAIVIGVVAGAVFSGIKEIDTSGLTSLEKFLVFAIFVGVVILLIVVLAISLYFLEVGAPTARVQTTEASVDEIAKAVHERISEEIVVNLKEESD